MPLDPASEFVKDEVEKCQLFDGRYSDVKLVNYNALSDEKRGCFSLVFSATDEVLGRKVALKFFEPAWNADIYRRNAFLREHEILAQLLTAERCLQLTAGLKKVSFTAKIEGGKELKIPCEYFAVEWLDGELDEFFLGKVSFDPVNRLRLFNEMALAIEALHGREIFHRDLKQDNMRAYGDALRRIVVAIDLGTAARFESAAIGAPYTGAVGASGYAAPEARCGLAGNRVLAQKTDLYALGCLLFELFNPGYFFSAVENVNVRYKLRLAAMGAELSTTMEPAVQVVEWNAALAKHAAGVSKVQIDGAGSDVPASVAQILNEILHGLTSFDYRNRPKLSWVRQKIWIAIKVLENERLSRARLNSLRLRRERKAAKAAAREEKFLAFKAVLEEKERC